MPRNPIVLPTTAPSALPVRPPTTVPTPGAMTLPASAPSHPSAAPLTILGSMNPRLSPIFSPLNSMNFAAASRTPSSSYALETSSRVVSPGANP